MQIFLNCTDVIELDLSNNMLTKIPLEISFLTCLTKLDVRNNPFSNVKIYI
jgi:Leucine-rich repeat (LRR) protein